MYRRKKSNTNIFYHLDSNFKNEKFQDYQAYTAYNNHVILIKPSHFLASTTGIFVLIFIVIYLIYFIYLTRKIQTIRVKRAQN